MKEISFSAKQATFLLNCEADGSGDYLIALEAEVGAFRGHADGHVVGKSWNGFRDDLIKLERDRKGRAHLGSALPEEFEVSIQAIDSRGHMSVSGELRYRKNEQMEQRLHFEFEFDPSQLAVAVRSIDEEK